MFLSVKNTIFHSPLLQNATQTLTPSSLPPTTTNGRHEPPLLFAEPPHQEEHLNRSGILRILLKDSVEKIPPILHFKASLR
ncbi:hypothetical protein HKD37_20G056123 [Glycine soja]